MTAVQAQSTAPVLAGNITTVTAALSNPQGIAVDAAGNIYIADSLNQVVERIDAGTQNVTIVAGVMQQANFLDNVPATRGLLNNPTAVALDVAGNVYIADQGNNRIRKVDDQSGVISTFAGTGVSCGGPNYATCSGDGGFATSASISGPAGVAVDAAGNVYVSELFSNAIRKVSTAGQISTVFGGANSSLNTPFGISLDGGGNLYIADSQNNAVRKVVLSSGASSVIASASEPLGVWADPAGNVYIAEFGGNRIRYVSATSGVVFTIAGTGVAGYSGDRASALGATLNSPSSIALDGQGNLFIADSANNALRKVVTTPTAITWSLAGGGSPSTGLSFPAELIPAQSVATQVFLTNSGTSAVRVSPISISSLDFTAQSNCSQPLNPGASCYVDVSFTPQAGDIGALTAFLSYTDDVGSAPRSIMLTGTALSGQTSFAAPSLVNIPVGTSSVAAMLTLTNSGTSKLLVYGITPAFGGTGFSIGNPSNCAGALAPGTQCQVTIQLSPTTIGTQTGTLNFVTSASTAPVAVTLTATVVGVPQSVISTNALAFSGQNLNTSSAPQAVTISNRGTALLSMNKAVITGANAGDFSLVNSCGTTIAAGLQCGLTVLFAPTGVGARAALLTITTNASNSPQTVALSGSGVGSPQAAINISALSFSYQNLGAASAAQTITLSNPGTAALGVNSITITGPNASDFSATSSCGSSVSPSASCTISVSFTPSDNGPRTASLNVNDAVGTQTISLSGTGSGYYSVPGCTVLSFGASPNPIYTNNPYGITSVNANVTCPYEVHIGSPNGPLFATGNGYSSTLTGNWVSSGLRFFLQQSGNTTSSGTLANTTMQVKAGQGCIVTAFTASPNPIVTSNAFGKTSITAITNCSFDIRIGAPDGPEFSEGRGYNVFQTGDWIKNQMNMYLQPHGDTSAADTLSVLTFIVQGAVAGCTVNDFSAGQNPIITTNRLNTDTIHASATCPYDIRVGSPGGALLGSGTGSLTVQTGNWVVNGLSFFLQQQGNTNASGTLATFTINTKLPDPAIPSCSITQFTANPDPLSSPGPTTISVNANCAWDLRRGDSAGQLLTSGNGTGSATANSVLDGTVFYLQPQGDTNWQHNLAILRATVNAQPPSCVALVFSSTPIVADAAFGVTNITANATCPYDVRINSPDGALFESSQGLSSANTGNWVLFGQVFYLQKRGDMTPAGTLATNAAIILP